MQPRENSMRKELISQGYFYPRVLVSEELRDWKGPPPSQRIVIIQSAIKGGPTFEPAKRWQLMKLKEIAPEIIGVHSYAGPHAPEQIVNQDLERASVGPILANIRQAAEFGWKGVVINDCMADPGLFEARELIAKLGADLEMVAPAETSMTRLVQEVENFAIVGVADATPIFERLARVYGLQDRLIGVFVDENLNPADLHNIGLDTVAAQLYKKIQEAQKAGARGIVFGCTTLGGVLDILYQQHPGLKDFPLVEPMPITLKEAARRVRQMNQKPSLQAEK